MLRTICTIHRKDGTTGSFRSKWKRKTQMLREQCERNVAAFIRELRNVRICSDQQSAITRSKPRQGLQHLTSWNERQNWYMTTKNWGGCGGPPPETLLGNLTPHCSTSSRRVAKQKAEQCGLSTTSSNVQRRGRFFTPKQQLFKGDLTR
jgi:hypothetical protein